MTPLLHIEHTNAQRALKFSVGAAFVPLVALVLLVLVGTVGNVQSGALRLLWRLTMKLVF